MRECLAWQARGQREGQRGATLPEGEIGSAGLQNSALDISVPNGYTDPLRCLLAVAWPVTRNNPKPELAEDALDQGVPSWAQGRNRYARSESEPSEGPPLGRLAQRLDCQFE